MVQLFELLCRFGRVCIQVRASVTLDIGVECLDHFSGIARHDNIRGHIAGYNSLGRDNTVITDRHPF